MTRRVSHSLLDPWLGPPVRALYPHLRIPSRFPPEGIIAIGHAFAIAGALGFAYSTELWWGGLAGAAGVAGNHLADCVDGTHARATGQCRNGGELLDHFTDPLSFAYWLVGIAVAIGRLDLGLAAVICLFAIAVLTNIKAKMIGEFTLASFGPTEFKALLVALGGALGLTAAFAPAVTAPLALGFYLSMLLAGIVQLAAGLVSAVREVNAPGAPPDTSEWEVRR